MFWLEQERVITTWTTVSNSSIECHPALLRGWVSLGIWGAECGFHSLKLRPERSTSKLRTEQIGPPNSGESREMLDAERHRSLLNLFGIMLDMQPASVWGALCSQLQKLRAERHKRYAEIALKYCTILRVTDFIPNALSCGGVKCSCCGVPWAVDYETLHFICHTSRKTNHLCSNTLFSQECIWAV